MKLWLISAGFTFILMVGYLLLATVVVLVMSHDTSNLDPSVIRGVDFPFRGPKYVYYYFFPPTAVDFSTNPEDIGFTRAALAGVFFITNLLLYSLPVHFLIRLILRSWKVNQHEGSLESPPAPPRF